MKRPERDPIPMQVTEHGMWIEWDGLWGFRTWEWLIETGGDDDTDYS